MLIRSRGARSGRFRLASKPRLESLEGRRVYSATPIAAPAGPLVQASQLWIEGGKVQGFIISFNQPMAPGPVQDPRNFQIYELSPFSQVPLSRAVYVPTLREVILIPAYPMPVTKYSAASGAAGHPSQIVNTVGQGINNQGTGYPNDVLFAMFPTQGYSPGIVLQARLAAQHRKQQIHNTLNHIFNPFSNF
jgi:hypothetical protein